MFQVSIENTSALGRQLTVAMPASQLQKTRQTKINELAKNTHVDGFQRGSPRARKRIEQKFGPRIEQEVMQELIESSLGEILKEHDLNPAGQPEVRSLKPEGENFEYTVHFEIYPEVSLNELDGFEIEEPEVDIQAADIDKALTELRSEHGQWQEVERAARESDELVINFESFVDGKAYEHSSGEDVHMVLGEGHFIEPLEQGLVGATKGQKLDLDIPFPDTWRLEALKGKTAKFKIEVLKVSEKKLAELDETLANQIKAKDATADGIQARLKQILEKQKNDITRARVKDLLIKELLERHPFELPKALVEREMAELHQELHRNAQTSEKDCQEQHSDLEPQARSRVSLGLLLSEVIKKADLKLDPSLVTARIHEIGEAFGNAEFVENIYRESEQLLKSVQNGVMMDQAIDHLLAKVTIKATPMSFTELLDLKKI